MIPKVLHYCWFGRGPLDTLSLKCIDSWKKYCPDYQIKVWNEDNFDIHQNTFVEEAYAERKWAFVTDYVRLYVLYHEGGIYLDADVELVKNLDDLLSLGGVVTGYQDCTIPAAIMLAEKGNPWIYELLSYYDNRHFCLPDGRLDMIQNDRIITMISIKKCGFKMWDSEINFGNVLLFPAIYFGPNRKSRDKTKTLEKQFKLSKKKTYAIHHGNGSWSDVKNTRQGKTRLALTHILRQILPEFLYVRIKWIYIKYKLDEFWDNYNV